MVRAVRASYEIDDGHASDNWHNAWRQMGHYSKVKRVRLNLNEGLCMLADGSRDVNMHSSRP